jgi:hypothetical protein
MWDATAGTWRLAWWVSDTTSHVSPWFRKNAPEPQAFLGSVPATLRLLAPFMDGHITGSGDGSDSPVGDLSSGMSALEWDPGDDGSIADQPHQATGDPDALESE